MSNKILLLTLAVLLGFSLIIIGCSEDEEGPTQPDNGSPNIPSSPTPADGAENQVIVVGLSWYCSDPEGDSMTYDIYFGTPQDPPLVQEDLEASTFDPGVLTNSTTYLWRVVAKDDQNHSTDGPVWSFTTEAEDYDNDSFNLADWVHLGVEKTGRIEVEDDVDYYKVNIEQPGVLDVNVNPVPADIDLEVNIYNSDQVSVANNRGINGQPVSAAYLGLPGLYYIKLNDRYNDADSDDTYTLLVTLDTTDVHEVNNSFNQAKVLELDADYQCKLRPVGDVDFFEVNLPQPGVLGVDVGLVPDGIQMVVNFYDVDQNRIADVTGLDGQPVSCYSLRSAETCYIKFNDRYNDDSSAEFYTFNLNFDTTDVYEVNNTFNEASEIPIGEALLAKIRPEADVDYFKLDLPRDGVLELEIDQVPDGLDLGINLFGADRISVSSIQGGNSQPISLYTLMPEGSCYFKIMDRYNNGMSAEFYECYVNLDTSDVYELNNTFSDAKEIALNEVITAKIRPARDVDYFKFSTLITGPLIVDVSDVPEGVGMAATVYNSDQQRVGDANSDGLVINLVIDSVEPGEYYVKLNGRYEENSGDAYTLKVSQ
ncbi:MAG: hypothetical protein P9X24_19910 [Candidatus Hatepunaea meridiana]|nr:hypothetical protein [Candidatus Hatepunaea meridiana]